MQINHILALARHPADGASAAVFRILFGLLALISVIRFFAHDWIERLYIEPTYHLSYLGFGWLQPLPGWGMYAHFAALGILSIGIAVGYRYRICAALFFIGFTYVEILDRTTYLNHYYWMSLVSLLMIFLPLHRRASFDTWRNPSRLGNAVPIWTLWTLRAQVGVVYVFAGIAKLNPDWLLEALPLRIWLHQYGDLPAIGALLQEDWLAYAMSWSGAAFDLAIVPCLMWHRTRLPAYITLVAFHLLTWILFPQLGMFPWLMIGASLIFFSPDWPQQLWAFTTRRHRRPILPHISPPAHRASWQTYAAIAGLGLFAIFQIAMPLRHFAYPGNVRWNEDGYRFAWRVMLTEKTGFVQYRVRHPHTGNEWLVSPDEYLSPLQTERMAIQPDMIAQTARIIAEDFAKRGYQDVAVTADAFVAFNGRPNSRLIDPSADLAAVIPNLAPKRWVLPFTDDNRTARHRP